MLFLVVLSIVVSRRRQVLLVLDSVDALFEGKGSEACDRLVEFLDTLCSCSEHLRMLLTSEQSLLLETNKRFRNGTEKVGDWEAVTYEEGWWNAFLWPFTTTV